MVQKQKTVAWFVTELLVDTIAAIVILTVYIGLLIWSYFDEP